MGEVGAVGGGDVVVVFVIFDGGDCFCDDCCSDALSFCDGGVMSLPSLVVSGMGSLPVEG